MAAASGGATALAPPAAAASRCLGACLGGDAWIRRSLLSLAAPPDPHAAKRRDAGKFVLVKKAWGTGARPGVRVAA